MRWHINSPNPFTSLRMERQLGISHTLAAVLLNRGIGLKTTSAILNDPSSIFEEPDKIYGAMDAAETIVKAIKENRKIHVYSDYDVDGITSGIVIKKALKAFGAKDIWIHFPERSDGYGLNIRYVDTLRDGNGLLITVDNGITANEAISYAREKLPHFDIVVLDHHEPTSILPNAVICDPWIDKKTGTHLCGCAVTWKVCILIEKLLKKHIDWEEIIPYVALGTISDVMPMNVPENRAIVKLGLDIINDGKNKSISALMDACDIKTLTAKEIAWSIAPKLNSCSRVGTTQAAINLFLSNTRNDRATAINSIIRYDKERKKLTDKAIEEAEKQFGSNTDLPVIVMGLNSNDFPQGIAGIIAGKLVDKFSRPAIVYMKNYNDNRAEASCRSVPGISIKDIINYSSVKGHAGGALGHSEACGAIILQNSINDFEKDALEYIKNNIVMTDIKELEEPILEIDSEVPIPLMKNDLMNELNMIPFGEQETPLLCTETVTVECFTPFKNKEHLALKMMDSEGNIAYAIRWYGMKDYIAMGSPTRARIAGTLDYAKYSARSLGINYNDIVMNIEYLEAA